MNKKLLIAAVGAALVGGPTAAVHAGTTLYGHVHMSFDRLDNGGNGDYINCPATGTAATACPGLTPTGELERGFLSSNSTRIGVKGDEDLGGGLKVIYQIETGGIGVDDATSGLGGDLRNSFVGFTGSWGTVRLGRYDTPFKDVGRKIDNFNEQVGDARNIIGEGALLTHNAINAAYFYYYGVSSGWDNRTKNAIRYESPDFSGWTVNVLQSSNNGTDEAAASTQGTRSLAVNWSAGPLYVGFGWEEHTTGASSPGEDTETGMRLVGMYTFNDITLGGLYEKLEDLSGVSGLEKTVFGFAASMKMGNNKFKFHYFKMDDFDCPASFGSCDQTGGKLWAVGVDHSFSKNTMLYLNYAKADNDENNNLVGVVSSNGGHGESQRVGAGKSPKAFSLGTIVKF